MKRVPYISGMENSVTITLEKYHSLLDSETELKELIKNGKIKVVCRVFSVDTIIRYLSENEAIDFFKEEVERTNKRLDVLQVENQDYRIDNTSARLRIGSLERELEKIKQHWAYSLFID